MKRFVSRMIVVAGLVSPVSGAFADDFTAWVNKCVKEIDREGNSEEVVKKWCSCMTGEMDENEKLSVLAWVKTPDGQKAEKKCDASAGWVSK